MTLPVNALMVYNHTIDNTDIIEDKDDERFIYGALFAWALQSEAFLSDLTKQEGLYQSTSRVDLVANLTLFGRASEVR